MFPPPSNKKLSKTTASRLKLVCFLSVPKKNKSQSHSELETFILYLQVIWEIFPLHKNSNACTFIEYSIFQAAARLFGAESWLTVGDPPPPHPAAAPVPRERTGFMAVVRRNDIDRLGGRGDFRAS